MLVLSSLALVFRLGVAAFHVWLGWRMVGMIWRELPWVRDTLLTDKTKSERQHEITSEYVDSMIKIAKAALGFQIGGLFFALAAPDVGSMLGFFGIASPAVVVLISTSTKRWEAEALQDRRRMILEILRELDASPRTWMELNASIEGSALWQVQDVLYRMAREDEGLVVAPLDPNVEWQLTDAGKEAAQVVPLLGARDR